MGQRRRRLHGTIVIIVLLAVACSSNDAEPAGSTVPRTLPRSTSDQVPTPQGIDADVASSTRTQLRGDLDDAVGFHTSLRGGDSGCDDVVASFTATDLRAVLEQAMQLDDEVLIELLFNQHASASTFAWACGHEEPPARSEAQAELKAVLQVIDQRLEEIG